MLDSLTPEQRAKLARGWVWQVGQAAIWTGAQGTMPVRVALDPQVPGYLVVLAMDGGHNAVKIANLTPDLNDSVTADGLLRTARAMWRDESLHVVPAPPDGWTLCRVARGCVESWTGRQWDLRLFHEYEVYPTKPAALLAAILTAPEAA